jgi:hypothetical protein
VEGVRGELVWKRWSMARPLRKGEHEPLWGVLPGVEARGEKRRSEKPRERQKR